MSSYEETKQQESQDQAQLEGSIVALLEQVSKTIEFGQNVPTADKMQALKVKITYKYAYLTINNRILSTNG